MRNQSLLPLLFVLTALVSAPLLSADDTASRIAEGEKLENAHRYADAIKLYAAIDKEAGGKCDQCLVNIGRANMRLGDIKKALAAYDAVITRSSVPQNRASAHRLKADLHQQLSQYDQADREYRASIVEFDRPFLHLLLGRTLLCEKQTEAGKVEIEKYLSSSDGDERSKELARKLLGNPALASKSFAPEFKFVALDGKEYSLAALKGKVVVLDFWATWCPPCRAAVPELKELRKKYPLEKLVVISISADKNEKSWREYIDRHGMEWVHYRDANDVVFNAYSVRGIPTYYVISGDGAVEQVLSDTNPQLTLAARIKDVLKKMPELNDSANSSAR